ncbi:hypothetical protein [Amycolatopsis sp. lyj-108]|uniref:NucA/NucB deoxyribonuclease domain-containing protein n=1 Tax=Amycolatopsis sp. lyj-108 TaxID=2789286 RepID=UPI00397BCE69
MVTSLVVPGAASAVGRVATGPEVVTVGGFAGINEPTPRLQQQPAPARTGSLEEARRIAAERGQVSESYGNDREKVDSARTALGAAATRAEPPIPILDECLKRPGAGSNEGHILNRNFWCQQGKIWAAIYVNGKEEGYFEVLYRAAAVANPLERKTHIFIHGDDYNTRGTFSAWSTMGVTFQCTVLTSGCSIDNETVVMDVGDWDDGDWVQWNMNSDENVATQQPEKVIRNFVAGSGFGVDDFGRSIDWGPGTRLGLRCDSAAYFTTPRSCIFTDVTSRLNYIKGQGYDQVVDHIMLAQDHPEQTDPNRGTPKVIPGKWADLTKPGLNRVAYKGDVWKTNEAAKNIACATIPKPNPTDQCDEYPFATTLQGAGKGDGNFSVKYVNGTQNGSAGGVLRWWYDRDRVLYGALDEFYVWAR